jgi:hypothetical protein
MKKMQLFAAALIFAAGAAQAVAAQDAQAAPPIPYPAKDTYDAYVKYVHDIQAFFLSDANGKAFLYWEPFLDLVKAGRDDGVLLLAQVMRDKHPDEEYQVVKGTFRNPISAAYLEGRFDLVRRLIAFDRRMVRMHETFDDGDSREPLAEAVDKDDIKWAQTFIDEGADVNTTFVNEARNIGAIPENLLSVSRSKAMDDFLIGKGIKTVYTFTEPMDGSCNDDNVRLRSDPGVQGKVIGKLMKGDTLAVLATTYKMDVIDSNGGRWYKVGYKGRIGWVFSQFVECEALDEGV